MKRLFYLVIGILSLGIGGAGIFLPLVPTTPFILLSAGCFFKSSETLYAWIMNHRILGCYIRCYREYRAVPARTKAWSIAVLWITLIISMTVVKVFWLCLLLSAIGLAVTAHILHFNTLKPEMFDELNQ